MGAYTLVIGNKNYSSWSLRPWLLLKHFGIAFREVRIPLYIDGAKEKIRAFSPAGKVPILLDGELAIWDSLAIGEYLAERHPDAHMWPADAAVRARARCISAEMHSGFGALRSQMSMNCKRSLPGRGRSPEALADVARIQALWTECRQQFAAKGPFLFGDFSLADAMYAPVVLRFNTYAVEMDPLVREYVDTILALPELAEWLQDALAETEIIPAFEPLDQP
jgi:glutathione S-transferase